MMFLAAAAGEPWYMNAEIWVVISFIAFLGIMGYAGAYTAIGKALDKRAENIRQELDEAKRLRDDAQALLNEYQKKAREAESEAKSLIDQARRDADRIAKDARKDLEETIARRERQAEEKIERAEEQAVAEVKMTAIDAAVRAAEKVVDNKASGDTANTLIDKSISTIRSRLN